MIRLYPCVHTPLRLPAPSARAGAIYAQVLYVPNLIVGSTTHNVVYVASNNNGVFGGYRPIVFFPCVTRRYDSKGTRVRINRCTSHPIARFLSFHQSRAPHRAHSVLAAIDADTGVTIWTTSVMRAMYGGVITSLPNVDTMGANNGNDAWGVTSTPVIDLSTGTMFVTSTSKEVVAGEAFNHYYWQLWQLNIATGAVVQFFLIAEETATCPTPPDICTPVQFVSGPTLANSFAPDADANHVLHFQVLRQNQRSGLRFMTQNSVQNAILVVGFAGYDDIVPWHGWVLGINVKQTPFTYAYVFNTEKNGNCGGVWGAGYHFPIDNDGYMYLSVGNGDWTGNVDNLGFPVDGNYGNGVLKLVLDPAITQATGAPNG